MGLEQARQRLDGATGSLTPPVVALTPPVVATPSAGRRPYSTSYLLDRVAPLKKGSHLNSSGYAVVGGALQVRLKDGSLQPLKKPAQFVGFQGNASAPSAVLIAALTP